MKLRKTVSYIYNKLPVALRVYFDGCFNPAPYLNRQHGREEIVREIFKVLPIEAVVETGSFRGGSTKFFAECFGLPVYSVELNPIYHKYVKTKFKSNPNVHLDIGDSREFLKKLSSNKNLTNKFIFFYLDAHWWDDLPLLEEIEIVTSSWKKFVILVDDFKVPGDKGYGYDNYGPGKVLELECFPTLKNMDLQFFFPSLNSLCETGLKRGCVVFTNSQSNSALRQLSCLRESSLG